VNILVCCPTRDRADIAAQFADSVARTSNAHVAFYIDEDQVDRYSSLFKHQGGRLHTIIGPRIGSAQAYNALYRAFPHFDVYGMCADDSEFSPTNWDKNLERVIRQFPNGIGVAATHNGSHIQFPFVTRRWIELVGWVPQGFRHYAIDGVLQMLGEDTHLVFLDPKDVALEHKDARTNQSIGDDAVTFMLWCVTKKRYSSAILRNAMVPTNVTA
jgi:hypothetical protein